MQFNINFNIDDRIIKIFRKIFTRKNVVAAVIVLIIGGSIFLYASDVTVDTTNMSSGQTISSSQMVGNLTALRDAINERAQVIDIGNGNNPLGIMLAVETYNSGFNGIDARKLWILNPQGYIYTIFFDGTMPNNTPSAPIYYLGSASCTNNPPTQKPILRVNDNASGASSVAINPSEIIVIGSGINIRYYRPVIPIAFNGGVTYSSYRYDYNGSCAAGANFLTASIDLVEFTDRTTVGIPATITGPLQVIDYTP